MGYQGADASLNNLEMVRVATRMQLKKGFEAEYKKRSIPLKEVFYLP
jgi:L-rhamnose mutarotase